MSARKRIRRGYYCGEGCRAGWRADRRRGVIYPPMKMSDGRVLSWADGAAESGRCRYCGAPLDGRTGYAFEDNGGPVCSVAPYLPPGVARVAGEPPTGGGWVRIMSSDGPGVGIDGRVY